MSNNQNYYTGGDGTILLSRSNPEFDKTQIKNEQSNDVNTLISKCKTSKECLATLYDMFKNSVFAVAFSITADFHLSEDCVAETFIRLTQVKRFSASGGDGKGFILTIARNVALEQRRRYKKESVNWIIQSYGEADKTVEDSIFINQLLKNLNEKQRQVVILKFYSQLTFKEIAKIMKCPETTVKSRFKRSMEILQTKAGVNNER